MSKTITDEQYEKVKHLIEQKWIKIGNLEWLDEDLGEHNWEDAHKICKEHGGRLPTRVELVDLFDNHHEEMKKMLKDSAGNDFWSSTTNPDYTQFVWHVDMEYGNTGTYSNTEYGIKTSTFKVRCIRDIKTEEIPQMKGTLEKLKNLTIKI